MGFFKPAWQSDDWRKQEKALREVEKEANQRKLAEIAKYAPLADVSKRAIEKITDQSILFDVAKNAKNKRTGHDEFLAIEKLTDQYALADIAKNDEDWTVRRAAIGNIFDQDILIDITKREIDWRVRLQAVIKITDKSALERIAMSDSNYHVRREAVGKITDKSILEKIAMSDIDEFVRKAARSNPNSKSKEPAIKEERYNSKENTNLSLKGFVREDETGFIRRSRGTEIPKHAQRIFLCCDGCDDNIRETLINDIFSFDIEADCVITYLNRAVDKEILLNELHRSKLVILVVSEKLIEALKDNGSIMYSTARESERPIIPFAIDDSLFPQFTKLSGAIHGVSLNDVDYKKKLEAHLNTYIASRELEKEIAEKAFTANLFLSYRKKDLSIAVNFMKEFYQIPKFESISIWYDNFLTAGRIFDDEIKESINKCDIFVLLVTPNLLEKNNYVLKEEYPYAKKIAQKHVLAIEAIPTDKEAFDACFPDVDVFVSYKNMESCFLKYLPSDITQQTLTPERSFLLGLAFRKGVLVQQSTPQAIKLLTVSASETSEAALNASEQLAYFYEFGNDLRDTYRSHMDLPSNEALKWRIRCLDLSREIFGEKNRVTAIAYNNLGLLYDKLGEYSKAMDAYKNDLNICLSVLGKEHAETATTYDNISQLFIRMNDYDKAIEMGEISLGIKQRVLGIDHLEVSRSYNNTANAYFAKGLYGKALELQKRAIDIRERKKGTDDSEIAIMYYNLGILYAEKKEFQIAIQYCKKSIVLMEKYYGADHIKTRIAKNTLENICTNVISTL